MQNMATLLLLDVICSGSLLLMEIRASFRFEGFSIRGPLSARAGPNKIPGLLAHVEVYDFPANEPIQ